ncbi:NIF system FeS cluster assembly protein NifU, N-terminal domain-containing protein [[Mycoplasma] cavipharyngis]|uniref:iron-sulfur cluster assembly scaffold protein n=1 Tax=[Mycoplasma] cavipharyngis TaxID=92757 RepID=UPI003703AC84
MNDYRSQILTLYKNPQFRSEFLKSNFHHFEGRGLVCDENLIIGLKIEQEHIVDAYFYGEVLCIFTTSVSEKLISLIINKSINEALVVVNNFKMFLENKKYNKSLLADLIIFSDLITSVQINCGLLPVQVLIKGLTTKWN